MDIINKLTKIINDILNGSNIKKGAVKLRTTANGVSIPDATLFGLLYTRENSTQVDVAAKINSYNLYNEKKICLSRQSFINKFTNIDISHYVDLLSRMRELYDQSYCIKNAPNVIAVDGTYSNVHYNVSLSMVMFDATNLIPIELSYHGAKNRGREVEMFCNKIDEIHAQYPNCIFVCDRAYYVKHHFQ